MESEISTFPKVIDGIVMDMISGFAESLQKHNASLVISDGEDGDQVLLQACGHSIPAEDICNMVANVLKGKVS